VEKKLNKPTIRTWDSILFKDFRAPSISSIVMFELKVADTFTETKEGKRLMTLSWSTYWSEIHL